MIKSALRRFALLVVLGLSWAGSTQAATLKTLLSFAGTSDGQGPYGTLTHGGGILYGTTASGGQYFFGTVFAVNPSTGVTKTIYSFTGLADGANPTSAVLLIDGKLYGTTQAGGNGQGTLFMIDLKTHAETVLWTFTGSAEGGRPYSQLLAYGGYFYGTTINGGAYGYGTLYRFDPAKGIATALHSFGNGQDGTFAYGAIVEYNKQLYGATSEGGTSKSGIVYRIDPTTGDEKVLYNFTGGADGGDVNASLTFDGGKFYGTSLSGGTYGWGTVFRIDPATGSESTVYSFTGGTDGGSPFGGLVLFDGLLWGTTNTSLLNLYPNTGGGTVFSVDPQTGAESTVYGFGGNATTVGTTGAGPVTGLTVQSGRLFGVTAYGGPFGGGTLFGIGTGSTFHVLHSFDGNGPGTNANAGLVDVSGTLYGTASISGPTGLGIVFKAKHTEGPGFILHRFAQGTDGAHPYAALTDIGGILYGTTSGVPGTVFKIDSATGVQSLLATFNGRSEGNPQAPMIDVGGTLYGTTYGGFSYASGSIFSIDPATGAETQLFAFGGPTAGSNPKAGLTNVNGILYGTTSGLTLGSGNGTVFKFDPSSRVLTTLYTFSSEEGGHPVGSLVQLGNALYGTTAIGGATGDGAVFKVDIASGTVSTLFSFNGGSNGRSPMAGLAVSGGKLIGTASAQGSSGAGTVFEIDPTTGVETTLYSFTGGADGGSPQCTLIVHSGVIYGTTSTGGAGNRGTVFSLTP